jgi:hypothetical protein
VRIFHRFLVCPRPCRQVSTTKFAPLGCYSPPSKAGPALGTASIRLPSHPQASGFWPPARSYHVLYIFPACLSTQMYPDCDYSLSVSYVQETVVSYRAQRPSHLWHILALIAPVIMCIIVDLIPVLALMPMPYYIFPTPFSGPKARRGDVSSAPASLLHLRGLLYCPVCPRPRPSGFISDTETPLS